MLTPASTRDGTGRRGRAASGLTRISQTELHRLLLYDPDTGHFTRRVTTSSKGIAGARAGYLNPNGYRTISVAGHGFPEHRVVWFYVHGEWPETMVDHANGVACDNRIANLRLADHSANGANRRNGRNNTSGFKGVSFRKNYGTFEAAIKVHGKTRFLGRYETALEAHKAYLEAARHSFGDFARGG